MHCTAVSLLPRAVRSPGTVVFCWSALVALGCSFALGCSVDDRALSTQGGGALLRDGSSNNTPDGSEAGSLPTEGGLLPADSSTPPALDSGAAPTVGDSGSVGTDATAPPIPVDECEVEAQQLQVENARFNANASGWDADGNSTKVWSNVDANEQSSSGSLSVTNTYAGSGAGVSTTGASQCLSIAARTEYQVCVDYLLPEQSPSDTAAALTATLFDGTDCTGTRSSSVSLQPATQRGSWYTHKASLKPPTSNSSYRSMLFKLAAAKPHTEAELEVLFDNVRIGAVDDD